MSIISYNPDNFLKKIKSLFGGFPVCDSYNVGCQPLELGGNWQLVEKEKLTLAGYFTSANSINGGVSLLRGSTTVMSLTPMEIESHLVPMSSAEGRVVVAGLGLAMITLNLLRKKSVRKLTVLEKDASIISMYPDVLVGESKALWNDSISSGRLCVIQADCTQPISQAIRKQIGKVDYLWVDIWDVLGDKQSLYDTQFLCNQLSPRKADFWGCELFLALNTVLNNTSFKPKPIIDFARKSGIPFSVLTMPSKALRMYTMLCYGASRNILQQEKVLKSRGLTQGVISYQ